MTKPGVRHDAGPVLIADGDPAFQTFLSRLLHRLALPVVLASTGAEALLAARESRPVVVVLDVGLPDVSGLEVCRELREELGEELPIILVSGKKTDPHDRVAGLLLGADDYLNKPIDQTLFIARVRRLVARVTATAGASEPAESPPAGDHRLTPRELEVLELLADGHSRSAIAGMLVISPRTVGSHIEHLLSKLGVHSTTQAVATAYRDRLLASAAGEVPGSPR